MRISVWSSAVCSSDLPRSAVFTPDGWYPTGDLGRLDSDRYLWFYGRVDDMFKVKGATVYPSEVEAAFRSMPGVRQAHVADARGHAGRPQVGRPDVLRVRSVYGCTCSSSRRPINQNKNKDI